VKDSGVSRWRGRRVVAVATVVVVIAGLASLGTHWWRGRSLTAHLDRAPVPSSWVAVRTIKGHGVDPLAGDHDPWIARLYTTRQPWLSAVTSGESFLEHWGCTNVTTSELPPTNQRVATYQTDCGSLNATLTVSRNTVSESSTGRSFRASAPTGGAAIELWLTKLSSLGG
jgi:hypothetical protein